jgi:hypothetical protein
MLTQVLVSLLLTSYQPQEPAFRPHTIYYFSEYGEPCQARHESPQECGGLAQDFRTYDLLPYPQDEVIRRKMPVVIRLEDTNELLRKPLL